MSLTKPKQLEPLISGSLQFLDWTVSDGSGSSASRDQSATTSHEHLREQDAVMHGTGLFCGGLLRYLWRAILV